MVYYTIHSLYIGGLKMQGDDTGILNGSKKFFSTYFGLTLQLVLLIILFVVGIIYPLFYSGTNLLNVFYTCVIYALLALGLALPAYVKHIDLSGAAVFALSAWIFAAFVKDGMPVWGFALAITAGIVVGIINGLINSLIRISSAVLRLIVSASVTLGMSVIIIWIQRILMNGQPVTIDNMGQNRPLTAILMLFTALAAALLLLFTAKLGKEDKRKSIMIAYIGSAAVSALAGYYFVLLYHFAHPSMGTENIIYVVFAAGSVLTARLFKKRLLPIFLALLAAISWTILSNIFYLIGVGTSIQIVLQLTLAVVFMAAALLVHRGRAHKSDKATC